MPSVLEGSHRELQYKKAYRTDPCKANVFLHGLPQELCQEAPVEDSPSETCGSKGLWRKHRPSSSSWLWRGGSRTRRAGWSGSYTGTWPRRRQALEGAYAGMVKLAVERRSKFKGSRLLWAVLLEHGRGRGQLWRTPTHPTREEVESIQEEVVELSEESSEEP